jgi:hypothetical protein
LKAAIVLGCFNPELLCIFACEHTDNLVLVLMGRPFLMYAPGGGGQDPIRFSYLQILKKKVQGEEEGSDLV